MTAQPTIIVVDDDPGIRESLASLRRPVALQVKALPSVPEFVKEGRPEGPACLVLDVRLPGRSGLDFQRDLAESNSPLPIISVEVSPQHLGALERLALLDAGARDKASIASAVWRFL